MDTQFTVPKIPIVKAPTLGARTSSALKSHGIEIVSSATSGKKPIQNEGSHMNDSDTDSAPPTQRKGPQQRQHTAGRTALSTAPSTHEMPAFPLLAAMPPLCPRCSLILIDYLAPIEKYIKDVLSKTIQFTAQSARIPSIPIPVQSDQESRWELASGRQASRPSSSKPSDAIVGGRREIDSHNLSVSDNTISNTIEEPARHSVDSTVNNTQNRVNIIHKQKHSLESSTIANLPPESELQSQTHENKQASQPQHHKHDESKEYSDEKLNEQYEYHNQSTNRTELINNSGPSTKEASHAYQSEQTSSDHDKVQSSNQISQTNFTSIISHDDDNIEFDKATLEDGNRCPFAYATIVVDNLSALNAILLLNSLHFYNNQHLVITATEQFYDANDPEYGPNFVDDSKRILARYYIPSIVFVDGPIDTSLLDILASIYDQMIELNTVETRLLDSVQYGIVHRKMHLWKQLNTFDKCIFLDPTILVVGSISNLFLECSELSACVDCFYPDHFNSSVLVFEPSNETFRAMLQFGLEQKHSADMDYESCDEATLLNAFFAPKWNRLSFVYNFTRTDHTYTQIPAYLKFGGHVRVVNFQLSSDQPWNFKFNLVQAQTDENPFETLALDNYHKFYLRLFMCRIWPLISKTLTRRILQNTPNKLEWTVCELLHTLSPSSNSVWQWNPITLRRKTPTTAAELSSVGDANILPENNSAVLPELSDTPLAYSRDSLETNIHDIPGREVDMLKEDSGGDLNVDDRNESFSEEDEDEDDEQQQQQQQIKQAIPQMPQHKADGQWTESMDWLGDMQSDQIINRLKTLFRN